MMSRSEEILESPKELAERIGWPLARIRKLIRNQQLRHVRVGGIILLPQGALEEYLKAHTVEPLQDSSGNS